MRSILDKVFQEKLASILMAAVLSFMTKKAWAPFSEENENDACDFGVIYSGGGVQFQLVSNGANPAFGELGAEAVQWTLEQAIKIKEEKGACYGKGNQLAIFNVSMNYDIDVERLHEYCGDVYDGYWLISPICFPLKYCVTYLKGSRNRNYDSYRIEFDKSRQTIMVGFLGGDLQELSGFLKQQKLENFSFVRD